MEGMSSVFVYSYDMSKRVSGSAGNTLDNLVEVLRGCRISTDIPNKFYHPVVRVHGALYDYNKSGIHRRFLIEQGYDREASVAHKTRKTDPAEFVEWLETRKNLYTAENYDMVHNNCIKFVEDVCEFLQIPVPPILLKIQYWLYQNRNALLMKIVARTSGWSDDCNRALAKKKKNQKHFAREQKSLL